MKLVTAHKILISAAVFLGVVFALWALFQWNQSGLAYFGLIGALSASTAIALAFYLRRFSAKAAAWEGTGPDEGAEESDTPND